MLSQHPTKADFHGSRLIQAYRRAHVRHARLCKIHGVAMAKGDRARQAQFTAALDLEETRIVALWQEMGR